MLYFKEFAETEKLINRVRPAILRDHFLIATIQITFAEMAELSISVPIAEMESGNPVRVNSVTSMIPMDRTTAGLTARFNPFAVMASSATLPVKPAIRQARYREHLIRADNPALTAVTELSIMARSVIQQTLPIPKISTAIAHAHIIHIAVMEK